MKEEFRAYAKSFLGCSSTIATMLKAHADEIARVMEILSTAWQKRSTVFIIGNGGSASTASHLAADLIKTVVDKPGDPGIRAMALGDNGSLGSAITNDWGFDRLFDTQLATFWEPGDVVIAISVNGGVGQDKAGVYSQNLVRALTYAKEHGGQAIGLVGDKHKGGAFKDICDVCVIVPAGDTPQVESFHVLINHLITFGLKEAIRKYYEDLSVCS